MSSITHQLILHPSLALPAINRTPHPSIPKLKITCLESWPNIKRKRFLKPSIVGKYLNTFVSILLQKREDVFPVISFRNVMIYHCSQNRTKTTAFEKGTLSIALKAGQKTTALERGHWLTDLFSLKRTRVFCFQDGTLTIDPMLPPGRIEPRASDFHVLHATVWANSLFAGSLRPLDPYIATLYWFHKIL